MCPWSLQANLFMGGQCTFVIDLCNTVAQHPKCIAQCPRGVAQFCCRLSGCTFSFGSSGVLSCATQLGYCAICLRYCATLLAYCATHLGHCATHLVIQGGAVTFACKSSWQDWYISYVGFVSDFKYESSVVHHWPAGTRCRILPLHVYVML